MLNFSKYHGTGNDFILADARKIIQFLTKQQIAFLCDRRLGIGADGLILLLHSDSYDFEMQYYNSDGEESTMCGNGGRCISSFAYDIGINQREFVFKAVDGFHKSKILKIEDQKKIIELEMSNVTTIEIKEHYFNIDSGSPHHVRFVKNAHEIAVAEEGKRIRNSKAFLEEGINVNFVEEKSDNLFVRTYERGVEDETLSCGTGVVAAAIASSIRQNLSISQFEIETLGGKLKVDFDIISNNQFKNIKLTGPATFVFSGLIGI